MTSDNTIPFIEEIENPQDDELSQVSVYRYRSNKAFDRNQIQRDIESCAITRTHNNEFGIIHQWQSSDIRALWGKLGNRTVTVVDHSGNVRYFHVNRTLKSSGVTEFFEDNGGTGILIYGGGQIQNPLVINLESQFGFTDLTQQRLSYEDIRSIFQRYKRRLKKVQIDPSEHGDWGGTSDAKLKGNRRDYIDVGAPIIDTINDDETVHIISFDSNENEVFVHGMKNEINVRFTLNSTSVTINAPQFTLSSQAQASSNLVFYDMARNVYRRVIGDTIVWLQQNVGERQLSLFQYSVDDEEDAV